MKQDIYGRSECPPARVTKSDWATKIFVDELNRLISPNKVSSEGSEEFQVLEGLDSLSNGSDEGTLTVPGTLSPTVRQLHQ